ncbi:MAG: DUF748 domain-containing protein [Bacteroidota bacterium]
MASAKKKFLAGTWITAHKKTSIFLIIILVLIIIRLFLPVIVLHYANKTLQHMNGYYGHIDDIDISLYRGAYQINDMYLNKMDSGTGKQTDFFKVYNIDLSVHWDALLHGRLVGEITFNDPKLVFTENKVELSDVKKDTSDFRRILKDFMPLKVNRFQVNNGELHYVNNTKKPVVDVFLKKIRLTAENLTNAAKSKELLPSTVKATAVAYEGTLALNMKLNPLATGATFDLNADLKNVNLVLLNNFLLAYGNFDVNRGNFGLYAEMAAKNNAFKGYVKPIIKNLDVVGSNNKEGSFFHKIWEYAVGAVGVIFRNQKKDQIATKVPLEGNFKNPKTNTLDAVFEVLRNAFIQALIPSVDNEINIQSVDEADKKDNRNFLQKIFGKKKKDDERNNDHKEKNSIKVKKPNPQKSK